MLNQVPSEANNSAVFLKNYLDYIEELPADISKTISIIRELEYKSRNIVIETEELAERIDKSSTDEAKKELFNRLTEILIQLQDIQSEKLHFSQIIVEKLEGKTRSIEKDHQNDITVKTEEIAATSTAKNASIVQQVLSHLPLKNSSKPGSSASSSTNHSDNNNGNGNERNGSKRLRRTRMDTEIERAETPKPAIKVEPAVPNVKEKPVPTASVQQPTPVNKKNNTSAVANTSTGSNNGNNGKKKLKKKKKVSSASSGKQSSNQSTQEEVTIDDENDDEETYCLCGQVSYGEMILCENDACKIEWFHFSCVSLATKPKGRWYCPSCRGDRPNVLNKNLRKKS